MKLHKISLMTIIDYQKYWNKAISFEQYLSEMEIHANTPDMTDKQSYVPLNLQRTNRILKTYHPSSDMLSKINNSEEPVKWLVISEHWCGDAAQILPVVKIIAGLTQNIELRVIYRDENLELIDSHLTNNGRSIPKILILDGNYKIKQTWGPRPKVAQELFIKLKSDPETAGNYGEHLHKWYATDKQHEIEKELTELI